LTVDISTLLPVGNTIYKTFGLWWKIHHEMVEYLHHSLTDQSHVVTIRISLALMGSKSAKI
jgi:hypothetical protein